MCEPFPAYASSLGNKVKHTRSEQFYKSVITLQQFGERLVAVDCNLHSSVSVAICVAVLVVCVTSVLCPCGWCCIHLSVTQKQMSPGRWGAADCRGDQAVAGWRCLRPAGPSRWKLRSLSAVLFVALFPSTTTTPRLLVFSLRQCTVKTHRVSHCETVIKRKHIIKYFTSLGSLSCLSAWWSKLIIMVFSVSCQTFASTESQ